MLVWRSGWCCRQFTVSPHAMSNDLNFWRYQSGIRLTHQLVYEKLSGGQRVDGLEELPIERIMRRIGEEFAGWKKVDARIFDGGDKGGFEIRTTPQSFRIDCRGMEGDDLNRFIDIGAEFGCPLYDPHEGKRYDLK